MKSEVGEIGGLKHPLVLPLDSHNLFPRLPMTPHFYRVHMCMNEVCMRVNRTGRIGVTRGQAEAAGQTRETDLGVFTCQPIGDPILIDP